jgi:aspartyl-tRNA(Asn)/glutamyl-tRNA(Gln) amidotransferase subunit C
MPEDLGPAEVERIAELARLALTGEEKALYARQLTRILEYARQIAALDTSGVSPTARVDEDAGRERPDEPRPSLPRDAALRNAPETLSGVFVVPRVIGEEH